MDGRQLLELAALACGKDQEIEPWYKDVPGDIWNPIDDDGDVFRLAVKLKISTEHNDPRDNNLFVTCWRYDEAALCRSFDDETQRSSELRLLIVTFAAEIGKRAEG